MAETPKVDDAEKAYAAAAAEVKPVAKPAEPAAKVEEPKAAVPVTAAPKAAAPAAKAVPVAKAAPVATAPAPKLAVKVAAPKITKKPVVKKRAVAKAKPAPVPVKAKITRKPVVRAPAAKTSAKPVPSLTQLKDKIMTKTTTDFAQPIVAAFGEYQTRAKTAYEKSTAALTEATEFAKGNVEAVVESGKILAAGVQDLGKGYVEEAKTAYETVTADVKELAAVKSPTELFQLQGKIARRNFDAMVATSTKNTDAFIKLATEAFAPLTGRVNLAAEKLAKVA